MDRGSAESRIPLMNLALRIIEDHPVLGLGANNFTVVMDQYLSAEFRRGFLFAVHNKYLLYQMCARQAVRGQERC
jgi:O-antigen ligase